ncbi:MAG: sulfur oxidation c-type cytochrome SoxX [Alphaproteobacteria bacterium]|nr:sulfur oxidation c-type cytochrome SoxX [Alphaproteobacteria bacterium]
MKPGPIRRFAATLLLVLAVSPLGPPGGAEERAGGPAIGEPLTAIPGDPARGRQVVRDTGKATCLICHAMPIPEEPDHGTIGPPLAGVARRATAGELRQRIVDATAINPATVMPPYFRADRLHRVLARHRGESIYTAQDVEDVVAYLLTLDGE